MTCGKCNEEIEGKPFALGVLKSGTYKVGQTIELTSLTNLCRSCAKEQGMRTETGEQ